MCIGKIFGNFFFLLLTKKAKTFCFENFHFLKEYMISVMARFSHADSIYQGIADHIPMIIFISAYLMVTSAVCFYIQWDVTLVMFAALPLLIGTRLFFSKVYFLPLFFMFSCDTINIDAIVNIAIHFDLALIQGKCQLK